MESPIYAFSNTTLFTARGVHFYLSTKCYNKNIHAAKFLGLKKCDEKNVLTCLCKKIAVENKVFKFAFYKVQVDKLSIVRPEIQSRSN